MKKLTCPYPYIGTMIRADGVFGPCCKVSTYEMHMNAHGSSLGELFTSDLYQDIRSQFDDNTWPHQCKRCQEEEQVGIKSHRQKAIDKFGIEFINSKSPKILELSFGNICNAACVICDNGNSSKWLKDSQYINEHYPQVFSRHIIGIHDHDFNQWSDEEIKKIEVLQFGQSEVLVQKGFRTFLNRLASLNKMKDVAIELNTNGGVFPEPDLLNLLKSAKSVEVQVSIDGLYEDFEHLRYPLKWPVVEKNIISWAQVSSANKNFHLACRFTFSALNLACYAEVNRWWDENIRKVYQINIGKVNHGYVKFPSYLRPGLRPTQDGPDEIPADIKKLIAAIDFSSPQIQHDQHRLELFLQILNKRRSSNSTNCAEKGR